jgi:hypothetical protein
VHQIKSGCAASTEELVSTAFLDLKVHKGLCAMCARIYLIACMHSSQKLLPRITGQAPIVIIHVLLETPFCDVVHSSATSPDAVISVQTHISEERMRWVFILPNNALRIGSRQWPLKHAPSGHRSYAPAAPCSAQVSSLYRARISAYFGAILARARLRRRSSCASPVIVMNRRTDGRG